MVSSKLELKKVTYRNNPRLRRPDVEIPMTDEEWEEYRRCARDHNYFLNHYYKIISLDHGEIQYNPFGFQTRMTDTFVNNRFVICMLPRQMGKSVCVIGFLLWMVLFNELKNIGILANEADNAQRLLAQLKFAYERIPLWMQQGVVEWNKTSIELENGSKATSDATTATSARGRAYNVVFLDEYAFVPTNVAEEFYSAVFPTLSSGETTQMIIVSTPNGMNTFYTEWCRAKRKESGFVPIEVHWSEHPKRDKNWEADMRSKMTADKFAQEFECQFLGGANALFSSSVLAAINPRRPIIVENRLHIHELPKKDHRYVITVDPAEGVGQDYSAFSVIDVTSLPYKLVAKYRDKEVSVFVLPRVIFETATRYNKAYVLLETQSSGAQVGHQLFMEYEYENLLTTVPKQRQGPQLKIGFQGSQTAWGIKTTITTKATGCANLKAMVENGKLEIEDADVIEEASKFTYQGKAFKAEEGEHDDLIMSLVLFGWLAKQPMFTGLTSIDVGERAQIEEESQAFVPFIVNNHGTDDDEDGWTTIDIGDPNLGGGFF